MLTFQIAGRNFLHQIKWNKNDTSWISISDPAIQFSTYGDELCHASLKLKFHDMTLNEYKTFDSIDVKKYKLFSENQAEEIIRFVLKEMKAGISRFIVNCEAGISRSAGIIVGLSEIFNHCKPEPWNQFSFHNYYIRDTLLNVWREKFNVD